MTDYSQIRGERFGGSKLAYVTSEATYNFYHNFYLRECAMKRKNTCSLFFNKESYSEIKELGEQPHCTIEHLDIRTNNNALETVSFSKNKLSLVSHINSIIGR